MPKRKPSPCVVCPVRADCQQVCPGVAGLLPPEDRGRVAGLARRNALYYARRLERRRSYTRFLLDWRHLLCGRQRQVFDLRYNDALSLSEIAARLGVTPSSARVYLRRAIARIHRLAWRR
jgi:hypothetical protein